jgi:hypothetical protein
MRRHIHRPIRSNVLMTKFRGFDDQITSNSSYDYHELGFAPHDILGFAAIAANFERFRIHLFTVKIIPSANVNSNVDIAQLGEHGAVRTTSSYFSQTPSFGWEQMVNCDATKIVRGTQVLKLKCIPNTLTYGVGITAGVPSPKISGIEYKKWYTTSNTNCEFLTFFWMRNKGVSTDPIRYTFYYTYYVEFRDRLTAPFAPPI